MGGWTQWVHSLWHSLPAHWFCQPFLATAVNINSECLLRFVLATIYENWSLCFIILASVPAGEEGERREGSGGIACHRMRWNSFALRLFFSSSFFFYCCLLVSSLPRYFMQNRPLHFPSPCPPLPLPSVIQWANLRCKLPTSLDLAPGRSCDFSCYCSCSPPCPCRLPPRLDLHWFRFCHVFTSYLCVLPRLLAPPPPLPSRSCCRC